MEKGDWEREKADSSFAFSFATTSAADAGSSAAAFAAVLHLIKVNWKSYGKIKAN